MRDAAIRSRATRWRHEHRTAAAGDDSDPDRGRSLAGGGCCASARRGAAGSGCTGCRFGSDVCAGAGARAASVHCGVDDACRSASGRNVAGIGDASARNASTRSVDTSVDTSSVDTRGDAGASATFAVAAGDDVAGEGCFASGHAGGHSVDRWAAGDGDRRGADGGNAFVQRAQGVARVCSSERRAADHGGATTGDGFGTGR